MWESLHYYKTPYDEVALRPGETLQDTIDRLLAVFNLQDARPDLIIREIIFEKRDERQVYRLVPADANKPADEFTNVIVMRRGG